MPQSSESSMPRALHSAALIVQGAVLLVLGFAGVIKLLDLPSFSADLATWDLLPEFVKSIAVFCVPVLEVGAALAFVAHFRTGAALSATAMLTAYLVVALVHLHQVNPPKCHCFGVVEQYFAALAGMKGVAVRSGTLLVLLTAATLVGAEQARKRRTE